MTSEESWKTTEMTGFRSLPMDRLRCRVGRACGEALGVSRCVSSAGSGPPLGEDAAPFFGIHSKRELAGRVGAHFSDEGLRFIVERGQVG